MGGDGSSKMSYDFLPFNNEIDDREERRILPLVTLR
jgi:hypothetical protein